MTAPAAANPATSDTATAQAAWRAVREAGDIQFAPVPPDPAPITPQWLEVLGRWLEWLLSPLGRMLGAGWSWIEQVLLVGAFVGGAWIAWSLLWPMWQARKRRVRAAEPHWAPAPEDALALLEDADRLAGDGRYDEAAHLLLQRSVGQIALARPDWLTPSSTAREIGAIRALPAPAQHAFTQLATLVERARYALCSLDQHDWTTAREAYTRFALERIEGAG